MTRHRLRKGTQSQRRAARTTVRDRLHVIGWFETGDARFTLPSRFFRSGEPFPVPPSTVRFQGRITQA